MKRWYLWHLISSTLLIPVLSFSQTFSTPEQVYSSLFKDLAFAEQQHADLWGKDMYGPVLLVNPQTREVFSNFPDRAGALKRDGDVFYGHLPEDINTANTALQWNGVVWAMVMLPLPRYENDRINLLAHELFHVLQPYLGFRGYSPDNSQLDDKNGRIYLRLELEALRKALESTSVYDMKKHLTDAMVFREYRYFLYPDAKVTENLLELNEGMAEYTGFMVSGRTGDEAIYHFEVSINAFVHFPTFVRSFAYETTPIYGYLLQQTDKYWNKEITPTTNLTDFFIREFGLTIPSNLSAAERALEDEYDGKNIRAEETSRQNIREQQIEKYRKELVDRPHLNIRFERMHLVFDPTDVIPLDDKGNVYPTIRVTDNWGILDVHDGGLLSPHWNQITVSAPTNKDGNNISGDGWTLQLNQGYIITTDSSTGDYIVTKR